MKIVEIKTEIPYHYKKLKAFFISPNSLRLFYIIKEIQAAGHLVYLINRKYVAMPNFEMYGVSWEVYKNSNLKDKISVSLYPIDDNTLLHIRFETNRILPVKKNFENAIKSEVELLKGLLETLRDFRINSPV